ncbi:MAG TPA: hypothetical protein VK993_11430 [Chthoniobacterales bacterium]|nr:hypothetical protein [Chthoniobacterales bacterium]
MMRKHLLRGACAMLLLTGTAAAADFTVTTTSATGPGSLHQAIVDANALPGADRITFNIPGAGVRKIDVSENALPDLTDSVTIDGYTQPGSRPNTTDTGSNAVILVQIAARPDGTSSVFQGLTIRAVDCTLRGMIITGFRRTVQGLGSDANGYGVKVLAGGCVIEGNFFGTDGSDSSAFRNDPIGVYIAASGTQVGGNTPAARNVIGGSSIGIYVVQPGPGTLEDIKISGNQIGTNPQPPGSSSGKAEGVPNGTGIQGFANRKGGVVIGGTTPAEGNLISGNSVGIEGAQFLIQGNSIGLQPDRSEPVVNQYAGISIRSSDNMIGGFEPGAGNRIAFNQHGVALLYASRQGVMFLSAFRNTILSNSIFANSVIGIDLSARFLPDGPTSNDFGDADAGPNNLQNFPVIAAVKQAEGGAVISGALNSTPSSTFTVQIFETLPDNRGQNLLGTLSVITDQGGSVPFELLYPGTVANDSVITATATDAAANTSEFSPQTGPVQLANISTRGFVGRGANILIGGFIVRADQPKKVAIRALGPSVNVSNRLADPNLELYDASGTLLAKNDDWRTAPEQDQQQLRTSGLAPSSDVESALIATLAPGNYTAQVTGVGGRTGNGIVEVYDLNPLTAGSGRLVNISTRGFVGVEDNVLIGGLIVNGDVAQRVIARAIGPDLTSRGVSGALQDPTLELRDSSGNLVAENDNWRQNQEQEIPPDFQPRDERESVIVSSIPPGAYTAIVRGNSGTTGVALVEFYDLKTNP